MGEQITREQAVAALVAVFDVDADDVCWDGVELAWTAEIGDTGNSVRVYPGGWVRLSFGSLDVQVDINGDDVDGALRALLRAWRAVDGVGEAEAAAQAEGLAQWPGRAAEMVRACRAMLVIGLADALRARSDRLTTSARRRGAAALELALVAATELECVAGDLNRHVDPMGQPMGLDRIEPEVADAVDRLRVVRELLDEAFVDRPGRIYDEQGVNQAHRVAAGGPPPARTTDFGPNEVF